MKDKEELAGLAEQIGELALELFKLSRDPRIHALSVRMVSQADNQVGGSLKAIDRIAVHALLTVFYIDVQDTDQDIKRAAIEAVYVLMSSIIDRKSPGKPGQAVH